MSIKKFTLSNGIIVINDRRNIPTAAFMFRIKTGAANEVKQYGISHLTEHLMFKATTKRTSEEINKAIKFTGAISNAYTGEGCTCFFFESLTRHFETVLDIYADFLTSKQISEQEFISEKNVVLQEIAMYKDDFNSVNIENLFKRVFDLEPVGGNTKSVEKLKLKDILNYIKCTYIPKNITISVCSKFSHRKIKHLMEKYFSDLHDSTQPIHYDANPEIKMKKAFEKAVGKTRKVKKELNQTQVAMIVPLKYTDSIKQHVIRDLLTQILANGLSSILYTELREKLGLFYRCFGNHFVQTAGYKQPYVLIETSTEAQNVKKLIRELNRVIVLFCSYMTEKDLQKALNVLEMQHAKDTAQNIADYNLSCYVEHNTVLTDKQYDKILKTITFKDLTEEAKTWSHIDPIIQMLG